ncbi:MAG: CopG family ribbon-helix-helix protein, partial [Bacteroidota bacterium]
MSIKRFGVSLEAEVLEEVDIFVHENKFPNRSQAIRFLIEKNIVEKK